MPALNICPMAWHPGNTIMIIAAVIVTQKNDFFIADYFLNYKIFYIKI